MKVDYLIVGQGICGSWLSYFLLKQNKKIIVIDRSDSTTASKVASGIINPVTGRRVVTTWMANDLLPFVKNAYKTLDDFLKTETLQQKNMLVFPSAPDLMDAFKKRLLEENSYIREPDKSKIFYNHFFEIPFEVYEITPCYLIYVNLFLSEWKKYLIEQNCFIEDNFYEEDLQYSNDGIVYRSIEANKIIYCDGAEASKNKFWKNLPFVQNKGQALVAEIPELPRDNIYKFSHIHLTPWQENLWWIGSSNELQFTDIFPSADFKESIERALQSVLKIKFTITDHLAALRPATVERRPFVGLHPLIQSIGILNGMGSKGCSLAPWFASELAEHLINQKPMNALADVKRYTNVLKR